VVPYYATVSHVVFDSAVRNDSYQLKCYDGFTSSSSENSRTGVLTNDSKPCDHYVL
jgi:hypothetical protein